MVFGATVTITINFWWSIVNIFVIIWTLGFSLALITDFINVNLCSKQNQVLCKQMTHYVVTAFMFLQRGYFQIKRETSLFSWHNDRPFFVFVNCDDLKNCSVNRDWSALRETWTAKIFDCVHVHWRSSEENKSLIWPNDLNYHLDQVAWFNFTFDVTSHFSALRPT